MEKNNTNQHSKSTPIFSEINANRSLINQKGIIIVIISVILIILVVGLGAYLLASRTSKNINNPQTAKQATPLQTSKQMHKDSQKITFVEQSGSYGNFVYRLVIEDIASPEEKRIIDNVDNVFGWSFNNKYLAVEDTGPFYGILDSSSGQITRLPNKNIKGDIVGWTSANNLVVLETNPSSSGNQNFIIYSTKGEVLKQFSLVTPKSKENNAYFYHHITNDGNWLVYNAGGVGVGDGIEVIDTKSYRYNLSTYQLENGNFTSGRVDKLDSVSHSPSPISLPRTVDGQFLTKIDSKSKLNFGYAEYRSQDYYSGPVRYVIYNYNDNGKIDDKPLTTISYNKESITQELRILSISPNGNYIAYTISDMDTFHSFIHLFVKNLTTGKELLISDKAFSLDWAF